MENSKNTINNIKKVGFILVLVLIFCPLSFLISDTITNKLIVKEEIIECAYPDYKIQEANREEFNSQKSENEVCMKANKEIQDKKTTSNFFIISSLSCLVILMILYLSERLEPIISYSLFFGSGFNTAISLMQFYNINSLLGISIGSILFGLILYYINKDLKKDKK